MNRTAGYLRPFEKFNILGAGCPHQESGQPVLLKAPRELSPPA